MTSDLPFLSVAMTAFNEALRIGPSLDRIVRYLEAEGFSYEIIVYDDGSRDGTAEIVRGFGYPNVRVFAAEHNRGKGAGARRAILESRGEFILFTDADLSTPIEEVGKLLVKIQDHYDIAVGSRIQEDGSDMRVSQPRYRRLLGKFFHAIAWLLVVRGVRDTQAGFKCFRRDVAHRLFAMSKIDSIIYDVEILFLAKRFGYRVAEVPVVWTNAPGSRMRVSGGHALTVLRDLNRISTS